MPESLKNALKNPFTYVALVLGGVVALAYGVIRKPLQKVADQLPGSDAKA